MCKCAIKNLVRMTTAGALVMAAAALSPMIAQAGGSCSWSGGKETALGGGDKTVKNVAWDKKDAKKTNLVSTAVDAGDFTTLVSLVKSAGLADALSGDTPLTVFAPTDEAFANVPGPVLDALAKDKKLLAEVLTYHVVPGELGSVAVVGQDSLKTLQGDNVSIKSKDGKVKVDGAKIVKADIKASNGVIHVIDKVILPPHVQEVASAILKDTPDIVTTAANAGQFKTLASLLDKAGLVETLQGEGPYTVFAPTDDAFAKVPQATLDSLASNPDMLRSVMLYHVVPGQLKAAQVVKKNELETAEGSKAAISASTSGVTIQGANIVKTDIVTRNGVIHVIDSVILPPENRTSYSR